MHTPPAVEWAARGALHTRGSRSVSSRMTGRGRRDDAAVGADSVRHPTFRVVGAGPAILPVASQQLPGLRWRVLEFPTPLSVPGLWSARHRLELISTGTRHRCYGEPALPF